MDEISYKIEPVGVIHSAAAETSKMPKEGLAEAKIEIFERYLPALQGLEYFSHVYLICFFHKSDRELLKLDRQKMMLKYEQCDDLPLGVFASRSPSRPNPLSITIVKIKSIRGNIIEAGYCDAIDGTPVIDIKPYNGGIDHFMGVSLPPLVPAKYDIKLKWFRRIIENVTGYDDALSLVIAKIFADAFCRGYHYNDGNVKIAVSNVARLIDAAIFLADAVFSGGRIKVVEEKKFEVTFIKNEKSLKYALALDYNRLHEIVGIENRKNSELFDIIEEYREI